MIVAYFSIIITILSILLITFNVIKVRWYSLVIYIIGLLAVYSTTLLGQSVVGTDISRELQMSNFALANGWDLSLIDPSNTSFVVGWLVPRLSIFFSIPPAWVYKSILPIIFAFTPVLLYLIFKKQFGELRAFYASTFFIIVPVFSLEIATIGKSMVAETLMALCLWVMFTDWRIWVKFISMLLLTLLTLWAHYTVGILLIAYLICILIVLLVVKIFKNWKLWARKVVPLWAIAVIVVVSLTGFTVYYNRVAGGLVTEATAGIGDLYKTVGKLLITNRALTSTTNIANTTVNITTPINETGLTEKEQIIARYLQTTKVINPFLDAGLGKDFMQASVYGKVFRIIQYLTQLLVIVGSIWLVFNYSKYKFNAEFLACIVGSFIMLAMCIFLPIFASLINMTRNYHVALFFLAPMFILGVDAISGIKRTR